MKPHLQTLFLLLIAILLSFQPIDAQVIVADKLPSTRITNHDNSFEFSLYARDTYLPLTPKASNSPRQKADYRYFWEFGDGEYSRDSLPVHTYLEAKNYTPSLSVRRIYDDDEDAPDRMYVQGQTINVSRTSSSRPNPLIDMSGRSLRLTTDFDPRPGDTLTVVLSYSFECTSASANANIKLTYDDTAYDFVSFHAFDGEGHTPTAGEVDIGCGPTNAYPNYKNVFLRFICDGKVGDQTSFSASFLSEVFECNVNPGEVVDLTKEVVKSHDPNIKIMRALNGDTVLCNGYYEVECFVQFQNTGAGRTSSVIVQDFIHQDIDEASIVWIDGSETPTVEEFDPATRVQTWVFPTMELRGTGEAGYGSSFSESDTKGWLRYKVQAAAGDSCQQLLNQAIITFDCNEPIATNLASFSYCGWALACEDCAIESDTLVLDSLKFTVDVGDPLGIVHEASSDPVSLASGYTDLSGMAYAKWYPSVGLDDPLSTDPIVSGVMNPYSGLSSQRLYVPGYYFSASAACMSIVNHRYPQVNCGDGELDYLIEYDCSGSSQTATIKAWVESGNTLRSDITWFNCETPEDTLVLDHLPNGTYSLSGIDADNCVYRKDVTIDEIPIPLWVDPAENCHNGTTLKLYVSGGAPPYMYQWSDMPPTTADELTLAANVPATATVTFTVTVTDANDCAVETSFENPCFPVDIEVLPRDGVVTLFPNPAQDVVYLKALAVDFEDYIIRIFDLSGKQLLAKDGFRLAQEDIEIRVDELPIGLYTFEFATEDWRQSGKLVLSK